jgi:hypothetical protein
MVLPVPNGTPRQDKPVVVFVEMSVFVRCQSKGYARLADQVLLV